MTGGIEAEDECLAGGGESGALMRGIRWAQTPLGPVGQWPEDLRAVVRLMLSSRFAMRIIWGPEHIFLYNDAYRPILGATKHPSAMGSRTNESFREVWPIVGPMFERVLRGEAVSMEDGSLPLLRNDYLEECYFTLSYSPIRDGRGKVGGVLGIVHETTTRVFAERRLGALRELAGALAEARTVEGACRLACDALARNGADVPFALFYLTGDALASRSRDEASLVASFGAPERARTPSSIDLREGDSPWPLGRAARDRKPLPVDDFAARFGDAHAGPWPEPIERALVLPLIRAGTTSPIGFFVAGINPRHRLDDAYAAFFELASEHIVKALGNVIARLKEKADGEALARAAQDAERAAEAERLRLFELFMQAPMPVAIVRGDDLRIELANAAALAVWGKKPEIVGLPFLETFPEMRGQGFDELLHGVIRTGVAFRGDETLARLDRGGAALDDVYLNFVYAPLREKDGATGGVLVCGFEVTDQVVARRRVERLADELAAQKGALEDAHRMKDEFLATMSHELRTPLNAILGWIRLMRTGRVPQDRLPRALETIERNAEAQTGLIEDLLDVSRIITGKLRLNVGSVDLPSVVQSVIETLRPAAEAKNVSIHAVIDSHAGPITGDADRLSQIAVNLVSNAVKFTPKGGRIHIHLERVGSSVRLTVRDNGAGISPDFLPFVFDRFRQGDQAITRRHGGLGLGLSIVKHLVELHGGTITAESDGIDKGATLRVTIPLAAVYAQVAPEHASIGSDVPAGLAGLRVLVVDDEIDARDLMSEILSHAGIDVRTAENAEVALREIQSFQPHVLVCDVGMPGEDGYALMQRIRALPANRGGRIRAAAVTAYARGEDRRRALAAGFNLHLAKPVDPSELIVSVASLADRFTPV